MFMMGLRPHVQQRLADPGQARGPGVRALVGQAGMVANPALGEIPRYVTARADTALQITFGRQQVIGFRHRVARTAQAGAERARGWQALARIQPATQDRVAQHAMELPVERGVSAGV
jgi:hypothetical protein